MMELSILTYNTLFTGRDQGGGARAEAQIGLLNDRRPDVFLMQEAKGLEGSGGAPLYALEARIGMRDFWRPRRGPGRTSPSSCGSI